jgi:putative spermidine/putrescine transport system substrate-binding protein
MRFLAYVSKATTQARFQSRLTYGPTNVNAVRLIDAKIAHDLPTAPKNLEKQFWRNDKWLNELGPNGKPNRDIMIERWTKWMIG